MPKLGPKAFLQCAGFLRIPGGEEPLDNTSVHPESYEAATKLLNDLGYTSESIRGGGLSSLNSQIKDEKELAENLGIGEMTLHDIIEELEKPGRDPAGRRDPSSRCGPGRFPPPPPGTRSAGRFRSGRRRRGSSTPSAGRDR